MNSKISDFKQKKTDFKQKKSKSKKSKNAENAQIFSENKIICITGPMAAGKNLACSILETYGFVSIDADLLIHEIIETQKDKILSTFEKIAQEKKIPLLTKDKKINRKNLGKIVFSSAELLKKQEDIVYPEFDILVKKFLEENKNKTRIINATVLYKRPCMKLVDFVIFVDSPKILRFFRSKKRDSLSFKQIFNRFKSQKNLFSKYKISNADIRRVWNIGSRISLERKLLKILEK